MTIKEFLESKIYDRSICGNDLHIGRIMPFGKYKGEHVLWVIGAHPFYMKWVVENTQFKLDETETWWKEQVDIALLLEHSDRIIYAIGKQVIKHGELPETNPHYIVE